MAKTPHEVLQQFQVRTSARLLNLFASGTSPYLFDDQAAPGISGALLAAFAVGLLAFILVVWMR